MAAALCGAVRYRVSAEPTDSAYCHCRMCQRRSGAPAVATVEVPVAGFAIVQGAPAAYRSSPAAHRVFCRDCGTELYFALLDDPPSLSLNLGTLDDPEATSPLEAHLDVEPVELVRRRRRPAAPRRVRPRERAVTPCLKTCSRSTVAWR